MNNLYKIIAFKIYCKIRERRILLNKADIESEKQTKMATEIIIETFDVDNHDSIIEFGNKIFEMSRSNVNDEFIIENFKKQINYFNSSNEVEYQSQKSLDLLCIGSNILFLVGSENLMQKILNLDFMPTYKKLLEYYIKQKKTENSNPKVFIKTIFASFSNTSADFEFMTAENVKFGFVKTALDCLQHGDFLEKIELDSDESISLYNSITGFLFNNAKRCTIKDDLKKLNAIDIIKENMKKVEISLQVCENRKELLEIFQLKLVIILAFIIEDEQLNVLDFSNEILSIFIKQLEKVINMSQNNTIRLNSKFYTTYKIGFSTTYASACDILSGLYRVSVNDNAKKILYELDALPLIIKLFDEGNNEEQEKAADIICSMCFNRNVRNSIESKQDILKLIKERALNSSNNNIIRTCKQIIEMIAKPLENRLKSTNNNFKNKHIMISYNHSTKQQCKKLNSFLKSKGYKTWFDLDDMSNDIHDDMAKAVENASIVLICYSENYKNSNNCRLEAQYATDLCKNIIPLRMQSKYKADGWLGIILSGRLYINFPNSDFNESDPAINEIFKRIDGILNGNSEAVAEDILIKTVAITKNINKFESLKNLNRIDIIKNWKQEDIEQWLIGNNLKEFLNLFEGYDGTSLLGLIELKSKYYTRFFDIIDDELKILNIKVSLRARMKLFQLINELL